MSKPRVVVCQHGSRRRYAVPRMLQQADMLEALYTDSCEYSVLGKIGKLMGLFAGGKLKRLADRDLAGLPREKVFCSDISTIKRILSGKSGIHGWRVAHKALSEKMMKWYRGEDVFYNMYHENLEFLRFLQGQKVKVISDVFISPETYRIQIDEAKSLGIESCISVKECELYERLFKETAELVDVLLCPSEYVAKGVRILTPENESKIKICPYGSSIDYRGEVNKPIKGRFFWAGGDWVRKGLYYLVKAADELKKKYPAMEFRAAGVTDPGVVNMDLFRNITFLGKLNKLDMQTEFLSSDAFVFPTLSEGMAGVVIEAMGAGCPVITTNAAGIDAIENGKSGFVVPVRNSKAVGKAIESLFLDRDLRDNISIETLELANLFTEKAWRKRLVEILEC